MAKEEELVDRSKHFRRTLQQLNKQWIIPSSALDPTQCQMTSSHTTQRSGPSACCPLGRISTRLYAPETSLSIGVRCARGRRNLKRHPSKMHPSLSSSRRIRFIIFIRPEAKVEFAESAAPEPGIEFDVVAPMSSIVSAFTSSVEYRVNMVSSFMFRR